MFQEHRVTVVVPAHNEELLIEQVVSGIPAFVDHIIVVDDAWRYDDFAFDVGKPRDVRRFQGPGPGRWGITRTDVYFY